MRSRKPSSTSYPTSSAKSLSQWRGRYQCFHREDHTEYHYSFAVNRLELWAYLESQRFIHPVFREFYKERDVVIEERRMRTDSSPDRAADGAVQVETSFSASPYHRPGIG